MDIALQLKLAGSKDNDVKFFSITWEQWSRRNKMVYENVYMDPKTSIEKAFAVQMLHQD